jgi:hypothetical protein
MPRKKTPQPTPVEIIELEEGEARVYPDGALFPGSGQTKVMEYNQKLWLVMDHVTLDYFGSEGRIKRPPSSDYMNSPTKFAQQVQLWGLASGDGTDDSAERKKLYEDVKKELAIIESALAKK